MIGTPETSKVVRASNWDKELAGLGDEGLDIRSTTVSRDNKVLVIASAGEHGILYGTFYLLRLIQTLQPLTDLNICEKPRIQLRMLDHSDNLDGSVERGYAGRSLWKWIELPSRVDSRYHDYARANSSIGINGAVLNNVNANSIFLS